MIKHLKIIVIFICCPFIWPLVQLSLCITGHYPKMRIPGNFPRCLLNKDDTVLRIGMELLSSHLLVSSVLLPAGANIASFISAGAGELTTESFLILEKKSGLFIWSPKNTLMAT